ncbi:MAG TPA: hypothetical protein VN285_01795 [Candidatus Deferrimicrobium sp.]|nr:hypothetical protein [Candidatus Deferrimicrobium sp.]
MADESPKKGLSKGCLIALVVVGVLLLLIIIAGITCYVKKDELVRYGTATLVNSIKSELHRNPVQGVDTVRVNAVADEFLKKLNSSEMDLTRYGKLAQELQAVFSDQKIDSAEAEKFVQAMVAYYPELDTLVSQVPARDTIPVEDSATAL